MDKILQVTFNCPKCGCESFDIEGEGHITPEECPGTVCKGCGYALTCADCDAILEKAREDYVAALLRDFEEGFR